MEDKASSEFPISAGALDSSRRLYAPRLARVLRLLAIVLWLPAVFLLLKKEFSGLFLLFLDVALEIVARRLGHLPAEKLLFVDGRPPILYMRSHCFDSPLSPARSQNETSLAHVFKPLGPLVCIGKPNEILPPAGFHRMYYAHKDWQQCAEDLARRCLCVLIVYGQTKGVRWELKMVVERIDPEKLLLLFPLREYRSLIHLAENDLKMRLPSAEAFLQGIPQRFDDLVALMFLADWTPVPLPLVANIKWYDRLPIIKSFVSRESCEDLEKTLHPFLRRFKIS